MNTDLFRFGPFEMNVRERRFRREGSVIHLRGKVFDTLRGDAAASRQRAPTAFAIPVAPVRVAVVPRGGRGRVRPRVRARATPSCRSATRGSLARSERLRRPRRGPPAPGTPYLESVVDGFAFGAGAVGVEERVVAVYTSL
jgi:hypothetical protein